MYQIKICVFCVCIFLLSCESNKAKQDFQEVFSSSITEGGVKQFRYTLGKERRGKYKDSKRKTGGFGKGGRGKADGHGKLRGEGRKGRRGGSRKPDFSSEDKHKADEELRERMLDGLNNKLNELQYCRTGYTTLESTIYRGRASISGTCNEKANEDDKEKFGVISKKETITYESLDDME